MLCICGCELCYSRRTVLCIYGVYFDNDIVCPHACSKLVNSRSVKPAAADLVCHHSYLRLIDSCITHLRLKDLLGPVTRVKKKKTHAAKRAAALSDSIWPPHNDKTVS